MYRVFLYHLHLLCPSLIISNASLSPPHPIDNTRAGKWRIHSFRQEIMRKGESNLPLPFPHNSVIIVSTASLLSIDAIKRVALSQPFFAHKIQFHIFDLQNATPCRPQSRHFTYWHHHQYHTNGWRIARQHAVGKRQFRLLNFFLRSGI